MTGTITVRDVLVAARDLVARPGGWMQGDSDPHKGLHCTVSALATAGRGLAAEWSVRTDAELAMRRATGARWLVSWNDNEVQGQNEVVAAFDRAIALWDSEHQAVSQ